MTHRAEYKHRKIFLNSRVYKYSIEVVATKFDMAENSAKTIIIY